MPLDKSPLVEIDVHSKLIHYTLIDDPIMTKHSATHPNLELDSSSLDRTNLDLEFFRI